MSASENLNTTEARINGLNHITLAVSDLSKSIKFYTEYLGFKIHVKWDQGAYLTAGKLWLCLAVGKTKVPQDYSHIALNISESGYDAMADRLRQAGVKEWQKNQSEGPSIYILDPDGHQLEIHTGDLTSRLKHLKNQPYKGLKWF